MQSRISKRMSVIRYESSNVNMVGFPAFVLSHRTGVRMSRMSCSSCPTSRSAPALRTWPALAPSPLATTTANVLPHRRRTAHPRVSRAEPHLSSRPVRCCRTARWTKHACCRLCAMPSARRTTQTSPRWTPAAHRQFRCSAATMRRPIQTRARCARRTPMTTMRCPWQRRTIVTATRTWLRSAR